MMCLIQHENICFLEFLQVFGAGVLDIQILLTIRLFFTKFVYVKHPLLFMHYTRLDAESESKALDVTEG